MARIIKEKERKHGQKQIERKSNRQKRLSGFKSLQIINFPLLSERLHYVLTYKGGKAARIARPVANTSREKTADAVIGNMLEVISMAGT